MSETLVKVEGLYKKFTRNLRRSMWYGTKDTFRSMLNISYDTGQLRKSEFWALKDINFELKRGEVLGLIGRNGCGKSTLLRLLSGIFPPDKGRITVKGRMGALIAIGAGFHPHMTGRENIYLNGTILGMDRREIKKRFEEIVEFAEIGEFIDAPVATYSSGMRVRLGFAIAVHIEPNILLIDEVLSVGDAGFRMKSINKLTELLEKTSVIFVSHNMAQIARISTKAMLLEQGEAIFSTTNIADAIEAYYEHFESQGARIYGEGIELLNVAIYSTSTKEKQNSIVKYSEDMFIEIDFISKTDGKLINLGIPVFDKEQKNVAAIALRDIEVSKNNKKKLTVRIKENQFSSGVYFINFYFTVLTPKAQPIVLLQALQIKEFKVIGAARTNHASFQLKNDFDIADLTELHN